MAVGQITRGFGIPLKGTQIAPCHPTVHACQHGCSARPSNTPANPENSEGAREDVEPSLWALQEGPRTLCEILPHLQL
eukprot:4986416-Pyramimonas_sp.AAC.1